MNLTERHCKPCEGNTPALTSVETAPLLAEVMSWHMIDDQKLEKTLVFKNFKEAVLFLNKIGELAEAENHHPDLNLFEYKKLKISLSTHSIKGLSENDFIMAAKIDDLLRNS